MKPYSTPPLFKCSKMIYLGIVFYCGFFFLHALIRMSLINQRATDAIIVWIPRSEAREKIRQPGELRMCTVKVGPKFANRSTYATWPMYFVLCRLCPFSPQPPRQCLGPIPVISLLLNNTISSVLACLIIWRERFHGTQKEDNRGPPSFRFQSSLNFCNINTSKGKLFFF